MMMLQSTSCCGCRAEPIHFDLRKSSKIRWTQTLLRSIPKTVPNSNFTYTELHGLTTIDDPAFGLVAGQKVDILRILINSVVPAIIFDKESVLQQTLTLADLAKSLASSKRLKRAILLLLLPNAVVVSLPFRSGSHFDNEYTLLLEC